MTTSFTTHKTRTQANDSDAYEIITVGATEASPGTTLQSVATAPNELLPKNFWKADNTIVDRTADDNTKAIADALVLSLAQTIEVTWPQIEGWRQDTDNPNTSENRGRITVAWLKKYGQLAYYNRRHGTTDNYLATAKLIQAEIETIGIWTWYNAFDDTVWTLDVLSSDNRYFYFTAADGGQDSLKTIDNLLAGLKGKSWTFILYNLQQNAL